MHEVATGTSVEDVKTPSHKACGNDGNEPGLLEPLAVVGMAFELPQEATTEVGFWEMMLNKRNAMTEWPKDRVNIDAFYHPDASRPDTLPCRGGHFLSALPTSFDAPFFSITAAEAEAMDPQQRLTLETTFHALEDAGLSMEQVAGSLTSVHAGCFTGDYKSISLRDPLNWPAHAGSGLAPSMLSNRVSWFFDLQGASITVDTACSSSMTAFDLACQGLQRGDADIAIVVGVNLLLSPEMSLNLSRMNFLSKDSKCYSFDHRANGYGRGEGVGVLIIKTVSAALAAGDTIRAVVRATGSNQDGRTSSITQPSPAAQENLIKTTYAKAGLDMSVTRYVEAHGTGTMLGDPIEARAIGSAFKNFRTSSAPIYIGSVKSNIGHLEGASGVAGIIKTILLLERGIIVPNANFEKLNPGIDPDHLRIQVASEPVPWPTHGLRRASISSFGFGGANCHVVLDDAYNYLLLHNLRGNHRTVQSPPAKVEDGTISTENANETISTEHMNGAISTEHMNGTISTEHMNGTIATERTNEYRSNVSLSPVKNPRKLLVLSAADQKGISRIASAMSGLKRQAHSCTDSNPAHDVENLAYTLSNRRSHLNWRSFAIVNDVEDLEHLTQALSKPVRRVTNARLGWVFTGQGAQYAGMGKGLLKYPVYAASLKHSEQYLRQLGAPWSLIDELSKPSKITRVNEPGLSQPLCTAIQVGIVDLLRSLGVSPSFVVGHSSGEIAAAYAIGGLSHESACKVAFFRGLCADELLRQESASHSGMMAVSLSGDAVSAYISQLQMCFGTTEVVVACENSPTSVTLSGNSRQLDWIGKQLDQEEIFNRKLIVNIAYHSPQMERIAEQYSLLLGELEPGISSPQPPAHMVSSVLSRSMSKEELQDAQYWVQNMVQPVKFSDAVTQACKPKNSRSSRITVSTVSVDDILEIGPHCALQRPVQDILKHNGLQKAGYMSALVRSLSAEQSFLELIGNLFCKGYNVDVKSANHHPTKESKDFTLYSDLPRYPFDHSRTYWHEVRSSREGYRIRRNARLDFLGAPAPSWNDLEPRWTNVLTTSEQAWIADHRIKGRVLYPASGMIAMALEAAKLLASESKTQKLGFVIEDAVFTKPIIIADDTNRKEVEVVLRPLQKAAKSNDEDAWEFKIFTVERDEKWSENCSGCVKVLYVKAEDRITNGKEAYLRRQGDTLRMGAACNSCTKSVDSQEFYSALLQEGFAYGPSFQRLADIRSDGDRTAIASVAPYQWPEHDFPQTHVIHPATLDAMLQTLFVTASHGLQTAIPNTLPTRLNHLWIQDKGVSHPALTSTQVCIETKFQNNRRVEAEVFATDPSTGDTVLSLNMEGTTIDTHDSDSEQSADERQLCYEMCWKPDLDLMDMQTLSEYCEVARPVREPEAVYFDNIDLLLLRYALDAINSIPPPERTALSTPLVRYTNWVLDCQRRFQQGELSNIKPSDELWNKLADPEFQHALLEQVQVNTQGKFYAMIAGNLSSIIKGDVDALEIMFKDNRVGEFYRYLNYNVVCYEPLGRYLDLLSHKNPSLSILEIGAGTGGTTDRILDLVESDCITQYMYTDISPSFFEAASEKYVKYGSQMKYKVFDVEKDPLEQGILAGTYDIIVAGCVLHATKNLEQTLHYTRKLLKPGGKLILFEVVQETLRASSAFGLLPGWWSAEEENRQLRPFLTTSEWDTQLRHTGFTGVDLEIPDFHTEAYHEFSLIVATALDDLPPVDKAVVHLVVREGDQQSSIVECLDGLLNDIGYCCEVNSLNEIGAANFATDGVWISLCEIDSPTISKLNETEFNTVKNLLLSAHRVLWVTGGGGKGSNDPGFHAIDGLARTACTENVRLAFTTMALEAPSSASASATATAIFKTFRSSGRPDVTHPEPEYLEQDSLLHINRIVPATFESSVIACKDTIRDSNQPFGRGPALALTVGSVGLLDTIHFTEDPEPSLPLGPGEIEIKVSASGVNFRDCLTALGQLEAPFIGCECSGIVTRVGADSVESPTSSSFAVGDRVAGILKGTYKTFARGRAECFTHVPAGVSLAEAASSMVVFSTAWHALVDVARLRAGETVLIHSASGGTGQAAVQVAQYLQATVYATVGSEEKKKFLMETYHIPEERIFSSRNLTFAQGIARETKGRGVDVVLNSLAGESLYSSWQCIAPCGRFVEIGKRDIMNRNQLPMWPFRSGGTFAAIDLMVLMQERPDLLREAFTTVLRLIADKTFFVPQPFQVFGISEIQQVFRLLMSGTNYGKIAVQMNDDELVQAKLRRVPSYRFDPNRTYVIAGGLGGLGRSIAQWMANRGAKHLILLSRSGCQSPEAQKLVKDLSANNVVVHTPQCDVSNREALAAVLSECNKTLPPVGGCIQAAMTLKDTLLENMTFEDWEAACNSKIQGSWNLHHCLPSGLDFFVCLSSLSCIMGNSGQANYAAGNAYMDELARYRVSKGEKAATINLSWIASHGIIAESMKLKDALSNIKSMPPISIDELYAMLEYYCDPNATQLPHQVITGFSALQHMVDGAAALDASWLKKPMFAKLIANAKQQTGSGNEDKTSTHVDYTALLRDAESPDQAVQIISRCMQDRLSKALAIAPEDIELSRPLHAFGVDSLLGLELKNYMAKQFDADIAVFDLMGASSIEVASTLIMNRSNIQRSKEAAQ